MTEPARARELELLRRAERIVDATSGEACAVCSAPAHHVVEVRDEAGLVVRLGVRKTCGASFVVSSATIPQ